jgi:hypothetical protein
MLIRDPSFRVTSTPGNTGRSEKAQQEETMDRMRRSLLQLLATMPPALWTGSFISSAAAQPNPTSRLLLKGGYIVSCDRSVGEIKSGDLLINGSKIEAIGPALSAPDAEVIDATNKLVLPGLIDTHRHTWETQLRSMIPEGDFFVYLKVVLQTLAPRYRPEDVYRCAARNIRPGKRPSMTLPSRANWAYGARSIWVCRERSPER